MNAEIYKQLKEKVVELDNVSLINLFEILADELNYRKIKVDTGQLNQDASGKI